MKPLAIVGVGSWAHVAGDAPAELRAELKSAVPNAPRRLNRLIELALIGAHRALAGSLPPPGTAIYTAFTSGCIGDSALMVNNVVHGRPSMPVTFINVSSNMAGFYVASSLGLHSANHVVSATDFAWESALELGLLGAGRSLLLGAVEECAWPLPEHRERLHLSPGTPLLESSQWLFGDREARASRGAIRHVERVADDAALAGLLGRLAPSTHLRLQGGDASRAAALAGQTGAALWSGGEAEGFTGLSSALACCRFLLRERGVLLHLTRGTSGAWYAVQIESCGV
ncbi:MAG TPA: hypothetical protein VM369_09570 [Candidatus Binatia bacterium]|nr:hypothetical protein [Candidatus Binatia bacterium]